MQHADSNKDEIIKCFHCGNETHMKKVGEYSWGSRDLDYPEFDFLFQYELFACPVCHKVTLRQTYGDESMIHYHSNDQLSFYHKIRAAAVMQFLIYGAAVFRKGIQIYNRYVRGRTGINGNDFIINRKPVFSADFAAHFVTLLLDIQW